MSFTDVLIPHKQPHNEDCSKWRANGTLLSIRTLHVYANPVIDVLSGLSAEEMLKRHDDGEFLGPDFLLQSYRSRVDYRQVTHPNDAYSEKSFCLNPYPSTILFGTLFNYYGEETHATIALTGTLTDVAGCWVVAYATILLTKFTSD